MGGSAGNTTPCVQRAEDIIVETENGKCRRKQDKKSQDTVFEVEEGGCWRTGIVRDIKQTSGE